METKEIRKLLTRLGIPSGLSGYNPLVHLIGLAMNYCDSQKRPYLKDLCQETANTFNTAASKIEDNAQTLIDNYWKHHSPEDFMEVTGFLPKYNLALKEFVFVLANYLSLKES